MDAGVCVHDCMGENASLLPLLSLPQKSHLCRTEPREPKATVPNGSQTQQLGGRHPRKGWEKRLVSHGLPFQRTIEFLSQRAVSLRAVERLHF